MKIDNYFISAENFDEVKYFYAEVLKFPVKFDFPDMGMVAYRIGNDEPAIIIKDRRVFLDAKSAVWIEVEDVRDTYDRLKSSGVKFLTEPFKIHTGWAVEFDDPAGNRMGFTDYKEG